MVSGKYTSCTEPSILEETHEIYDLFTFLYNMDEPEIVQNLLYEKVIFITNEFTDYIIKNQNNISDKIERITDKYSHTCIHSINTTIYTVLLCIHLNIEKEEIYLISRAAFFHDIGKRYISQKIIDKTSKLEEKEYNAIKEHPYLGYLFLQRIFPTAEREVKEGVLLHHGLIGKKGYPYHLIQCGIPIAAQIIAITDKFEAYTGARTYHEIRSSKEGIEYLKQEIGLNKIYVNAMCDIISMTTTHCKAI